MEMYLQLEAPRVDKCEECCAAQADGLYRCRDCHGGAMLCRMCIVSTHSRDPFHRFEEWKGTHFERLSSTQLGIKVHCLHPGSECPAAKGLGPEEMEIVDANGTFTVDVYQCHCARSTDYPTLADQLFLERLFPATPTKPKTAFTFRMLKDFQNMNLAGKVPLWDYFSAVKRKSN